MGIQDDTSYQYGVLAGVRARQKMIAWLRSVVKWIKGKIKGAGDA